MSAEETKQAAAPATTKKVVAKKAQASKKTEAPAATSGTKVAAQRTSAGAPVAKKKVASKKIAKKAPVRAKTPDPKTGSAKPAVRDVISLEKRNEMVATMAYHLSEKRGFAPGWELEDWLESERVVDKLLASKNVSIQSK